MTKPPEGGSAAVESGPTLSRLRSVAADAAEAAGSVIRGSLHSEPQVERTFSHDVKLWLDRACEQEIFRVIREQFPGHGILSEESGYEQGQEPFLWVVDPLDGTVNFHHGIPFFCSSVACHAVVQAAEGNSAHRLPDGRVLGAGLVGAVHDPLREETFTGAAGRGASLNQAPLLVPELDRLDEAIVAVSFGAREESISYICRALPGFIRAARKVRSLGSTALDMAQVAAGRIGAFVQMGTNLWDFAAAAVIVTAAGGVVDAEEYAPGRFRILASAPGVYEQVKREAEGIPVRADGAFGAPA
jgi:myo-inositol-1(or 4)-monophosphatase